MSRSLASSVPGGLSYSPKSFTIVTQTISPQLGIKMHNKARTILKTNKLIINTWLKWQYFVFVSSQLILNGSSAMSHSHAHTPRGNPISINFKHVGRRCVFVSLWLSVDPVRSGGGGFPVKSADRWCCYLTADPYCCCGNTHTFHVRQRDEEVSLHLHS